MSSLTVISKWKRSSSSTARAIPAAPRSRRMSRRSPGMRGTAIGSGGAEHLEDGAGVFGPTLCLQAELSPSRRGELVVLGLAIVLGESPLGVEPAALLHAMERRVERALFDVELVVGRL